MKLHEAGEFVPPCHKDCRGVITYLVESGPIRGECPLMMVEPPCLIPQATRQEKYDLMAKHGWRKRYLELAKWSQCQASSQLNDWMRDRTAHDGLLLHGPTGTGKTMAAALVAKDLWEALPSRYVLWPEMLERMKNEYGNPDELAEIPLLVIDDFGVGDMAPWVIGKVDWLFEARNGMMLPSIVTTNLTPNTLTKEPEWQRFVDRWRETMTRISMPGPSQRGRK